MVCLANACKIIRRCDVWKGQVTEDARHGCEFSRGGVSLEAAVSLMRLFGGDSSMLVNAEGGRLWCALREPISQSYDFQFYANHRNTVERWPILSWSSVFDSL